MAGKATFRIEGEDATARAFNSIEARARATQEKISGFMKSAFIATGATALIGKITAAASAAIELGDSLNKAAIKAGLGGREMSELAYAAKMADVDLNGLSLSLKNMQTTLSEAAAGSKSARESLSFLGLSIDQLAGMKADQQFEMLADRINGLVNPADRARLATELFGKAGADLLPLFEQGAAGIEKARKEAQKLGLSFDDETLRRLAETDDAVKRLSASWDAFATNATAKVAPALTRMLNSASDGGFGRIGKSWLSGGFLGMARQSLEEASKAEDAQFNDDRTGVITRHTGSSGELAGIAAALDKGMSGAGADAKKFADELERSRDAAERIDEQFRRGISQSSREASDELSHDFDRYRDEWLDRQHRADEFFENQMQREKDLAEWRDEQTRKSATVFESAFGSAFDRFIQTGKFTWKSFLADIADSALPGLGGLFEKWSRRNKKDDLSDVKFGRNDGATGFLIDLIGIFGSYALENGRANGGPVSAGRSYLVGERGMELFKPLQSGTIVPNHKLGSSIDGVAARPVSLNVAYHINNPDNTERLPAILKENNRRLVESLSRAGLLRD